MEKFLLFVRAYFAQIGSCCVMLFAALIMIIGSTGASGVQQFSVAILPPVIIFSAIFGLNVAVCCLSCKKTSDIKVLRVIVFSASLLIYAMFIIVYIYYYPEPEHEQIACILALWILAYLASDAIMQSFSEKLLKEENPLAYAFLQIRRGELLSAKQQMELLSKTEFEPWLMHYIKNYYLCEKAEQQLFAKPCADAILMEYIKRYNLNPETQPLLFKLADVNKWLRLYIEAHGYLTDDSIARLCTLSEAPELMKLYIKHGFLLNEASEMKFFELPNGQELYNIYTQKYYPCDKVQEKARNLGWI